MKSAPRVSVIVPAYNAAAYLPATIQSVRQQTFQDFEIWVVDDQSTDDTVTVVQKLMTQDARIKLVQLSANQGVANARNVGVAHAQGQYVAFLDSDDMWLPEKLEVQISFMQEHQADFSYCNYDVVDDHGTQVGQRKVSQTQLTYQEMLNGNRIGLLTVMMTRKTALQYPFPQINHEDYACWLSIARSGIVAYLASDLILAKYRKHQTSLSSNKLQAAQWTWTIYRQHEHLGFFKSLYYFIHYSLMGITDKR